MSAVLTLQGAIPHCDMPIESGTTMFLPHSQRFDAGYLAFDRPRLRQTTSTGTTSSSRCARATRCSSPRAFSRCGPQPFDVDPALGEPAADLVAVRTRNGGARPGGDEQRRLPRTPGAAPRRHARTRELHNAILATAEVLPVPHQPGPRPAARRIRSRRRRRSISCGRRCSTRPIPRRSPPNSPPSPPAVSPDPDREKESR